MGGVDPSKNQMKQTFIFNQVEDRGGVVSTYSITHINKQGLEKSISFTHSQLILNNQTVIGFSDIPQLGETDMSNSGHREVVLFNGSSWEFSN